MQITIDQRQRFAQRQVIEYQFAIEPGQGIVVVIGLIDARNQVAMAKAGLHGRVQP
ncbi:hypothetical protein D3C81_2178570 [compost metagenome]